MTDLSPQLKVLGAMLSGRTRYDIGLPDQRDTPSQAAAMLDIIRSAEAAYDYHAAIAANLRPRTRFVFDASLWDRLEDFN